MTEGKKTERMLLRVSPEMAARVRATAELQHRKIGDQFRFLIATGLQHEGFAVGNGTSGDSRQLSSTNSRAPEISERSTAASTSVDKRQLPSQLQIPGTVGPVEVNPRRRASSLRGSRTVSSSARERKEGAA